MPGPMTNPKLIRQLIVDRSRDRFLRFGFSSVTIDEIASDLRMSKKTLYNYFSSKEELLRAAIFEMLEDIELKMKGVVFDDDLEFTDKLKGILAVAEEHLSRIGKAFTRDIARSAPQTWKEIESFRQQRILALLFKLLESGKTQGRVRSDVDHEMVALLLSQVFKRVLNPEVVSGIPYTAGQVFENLMNILFVGILADETRQDYLGKRSSKELKQIRRKNDARTS
jgi:AcrR family transcriptional regulator